MNKLAQKNWHGCDPLQNELQFHDHSFHGTNGNLFMDFLFGNHIHMMPKYAMKDAHLSNLQVIFVESRDLRMNNDGSPYYTPPPHTELFIADHDTWNGQHLGNLNVPDDKRDIYYSNEFNTGFFIC